MFRTPLVLAFAATLLTAPVTAQIVTFGGTGERMASTLFLFNNKAKKLAGAIELTYGQPVWQEAHEKASGSMRLGKNGWTALDISVPVTLGGTQIPAGLWYLGLHRKGEKYSLMVINPKAMHAKGIGPWMTASVKAKIHAPLTHATAEESQDKLLMSVTAPGEDKTKCTFTLLWGKHKLTAAMVAHVGTKPAPRKTGKPK